MDIPVFPAPFVDDGCLSSSVFFDIFVKEKMATIMSTYLWLCFVALIFVSVFMLTLFALLLQFCSITWNLYGSPSSTVPFVRDSFHYLGSFLTSIWVLEFTFYFCEERHGGFWLGLHRISKLLSVKWSFSQY